MCALYRPVAWLFEDNNEFAPDIRAKIYNEENYGGVSQLLSIKHAVELFEEVSKRRGLVYDRTILYRPDVLLWKDMRIDRYDRNTIYSNCHDSGRGDFHFVMNPSNLSIFKNAYDYVSRQNEYQPHETFKRYVSHALGIDIHDDEIRAGQDQEVVRKLIYSYPNLLSPGQAMRYDLRLDDIY